jgi:hypothetical protein
MRLPRVRFTVRRMMVAVAVVAVDLAPIAWHLAKKIPGNLNGTRPRRLGP